MNKKDRSARTKRLTVCAMLSALGVVLLWLGSAVEIVDISMAVIASLLCVFAVIEYGGSAPWLIFSVTGVISVLLLPQKTPAVMYLLFFGYYPIIKEKIEKHRRVVSWAIKEAVFNLALIVMLLISKLTFLADGVEPWIFYAAFALLAEIAFPIYDIALTRLITLYIVKLRTRIRIK